MSDMEAIAGQVVQPGSKYSTAHVRDLLRKRYPPGEWAFMEEVAPKTGGGTRYADAVAVNLWQSRGHAVFGFEIKISRSDWLRELKDPSKAEPVYRYCDHWFIVAPKGVVKDGELPINWGLIEVRDSSLCVQVAGKKLEPAPLTRELFASLMRRGCEQLEATAARMVQQQVVEGRAEINRRVEEEVKRMTRHHQALADQVAKFEAETGLTMNEYSGPPIAIVKLAQRLQNMRRYGGDFTTLSHLADELGKAADGVRTALAPFVAEVNKEGG